MSSFHQKTTIVKKTISLLIATAFTFNLIIPPGSTFGQSVGINFPMPGALLSQSIAFNPACLKGIVVDLENPLHFEFLVDAGDTDVANENFRKESNKLIKYFLASLTVPKEELWVNLSPYEKDRIVGKHFGQTAMGRDLLVQDYFLKQLTSSFMHPDSEVGEKFWNRVRDIAQNKFGINDIPTSTFNKIWILPKNAVVYQHENQAFIVENQLKVMLEEDLVALERNPLSQTSARQESSENSKLMSKILKEVVIPEIEKEVNSGETFANLRQIYNSLILAIWYKKNLQESLLGQVYVNQNKLNGIDIQDTNSKEEIYQSYLETFKNGVYEYIKEEYDPTTQQTIPRKYFSGGGDFQSTENQYAQIDGDVAMNGNDRDRLRRAIENVTNLQALDVNLLGKDAAMQSEADDSTIMLPEFGPDGKSIEEQYARIDELTAIADHNAIMELFAIHDASWDEEFVHRKFAAAFKKIGSTPEGEQKISDVFKLMADQAPAVLMTPHYDGKQAIGQHYDGEFVDIPIKKLDIDSEMLRVPSYASLEFLGPSGSFKWLNGVYLMKQWWKKMKTHYAQKYAELGFSLPEEIDAINFTYDELKKEPLNDLLKRLFKSIKEELARIGQKFDPSEFTYISASTGNHAVESIRQAAIFGMKSVVFVPARSSAEVINALKKAGVKKDTTIITEHRNGTPISDYLDARSAAIRFYHNPERMSTSIMSHHASADVSTGYAWQLMRILKKMEKEGYSKKSKITAFFPVGEGGAAIMTIVARAHGWDNVLVVAVGEEHYDSFAQSSEAGEPIAATQGDLNGPPAVVWGGTGVPLVGPFAAVAGWLALKTKKFINRVVSADGSQSSINVISWQADYAGAEHNLEGASGMARQAAYEYPETIKDADAIVFALTGNRVSYSGSLKAISRPPKTDRLGRKTAYERMMAFASSGVADPEVKERMREGISREAIVEDVKRRLMYHDVLNATDKEREILNYYSEMAKKRPGKYFDYRILSATATAKLNDPTFIKWGKKDEDRYQFTQLLEFLGTPLIDILSEQTQNYQKDETTGAYEFNDKVEGVKRASGDEAINLLDELIHIRFVDNSKVFAFFDKTGQRITSRQMWSMIQPTDEDTKPADILTVEGNNFIVVDGIYKDPEDENFREKFNVEENSFTLDVAITLNKTTNGQRNRHLDRIRITLGVTGKNDDHETIYTWEEDGRRGGTAKTYLGDYDKADIIKVFHNTSPEKIEKNLGSFVDTGRRGTNFQKIEGPNARGKLEELLAQKETVVEESATTAKKDEALITHSDSEASKTKKVGGVNFNTDLVDLQVQHDGNSLPLAIDQQVLENFINVDGFVPVINSVTPVTNLQFLLGLNDSKPSNEMLSSVDKAAFPKIPSSPNHANRLAKYIKLEMDSLPDSQRASNKKC